METYKCNECSFDCTVSTRWKPDKPLYCPFYGVNASPDFRLIQTPNPPTDTTKRDKSVGLEAIHKAIDEFAKQYE